MNLRCWKCEVSPVQWGSALIHLDMPPLCHSLGLLCGKVRRLFRLMCSEPDLTVIRSYTCANEKHNGCNNCHALRVVAAAVRDSLPPWLVIIPLHSFCKDKKRSAWLPQKGCGAWCLRPWLRIRKEKKNTTKKTACFIAICFHCVFFLLFFCFFFAPFPENSVIFKP